MTAIHYTIGSSFVITPSRNRYTGSELTPGYYQSIRLHSGFLAGGLMAGGEIALTRTKYYDYQNQPVWRAVREL
ncbi:MAG: hypothetical protein U0401_32025 [Anaerolineae bacterium]